MKTQIRSLLTLLCSAIATLLILSSPAQAGYIVTLEQVGANVVATGSGAIDLTGLFHIGDGATPSSPLMVPSAAFIQTGATAFASLYFAPSGLVGPMSFGPGGGGPAQSGTGDFVGILGGFSPGFVLLPEGYMSGSALSDMATYDNTNFSSLGVMPGTYEWTWGAGENQNFTVDIVSTVPDQGSTFGLLALSLIVLLGASRFRSLQSA